MGFQENKSSNQRLVSLCINLKTHLENDDFDMGDLDGEFDLGDMDLGDDLDLDNDLLGKLFNLYCIFSICLSW